MRRGERMKRVRHPWALAGWCAVVALAVATGVGLASHAPAEVAPARADDRVPEDMLWPWVNSCGAGPSAPVVGITVDADGAIDLSIGVQDPEAPYGTPLMDENDRPVVDEAASQEIEECLSAHRVGERPSNYRQATPAERIMLHDWTARWQAPCLRGHGYDFDIPDLAHFVNPHEVGWFLMATRNWSEEEDLDFERVLDARLACEPVPPFLAAEGVYW